MSKHREDKFYIEFVYLYTLTHTKKKMTVICNDKRKGLFTQ